MKEMTASLVFTTINDPILLEDYFLNFKKYGHIDKVRVFVIPDRKTPKGVFKRCQNLKKKGMDIFCPTLEEQEDFLKRLDLPVTFIPYNSDNRRNIGYLMALEAKTDFIISIDDDNYCLSDEDFFQSHSIVCEEEKEYQVVECKEKWFNVCSLLNMDSKKVTYARGYPYYARHKKEEVKIVNKAANVDINAGLWLGDPDVDGISWLVNPSHSVSFKNESFVLSRNTWSPINTQNTSLIRGAVNAYYFVKMGYPLGGIPIDRYGDIFSGYFAQACVRHLNKYVRFGCPIAEHKRNSHNYMNDAANEFACIMVLEDILPWMVNELKLEGSDYNETYVSLSYAIEDFVENVRGKIWNDATRGYFHQMAHCMRLWARVCKKLD